MAYISTTLSHLKFDSLPVSDALGTVVYSIGGTPTLTDGVFGQAYQMENNKKLYLSSFFDTSKLSVAFWLKSVNPGVVTTLNHVINANGCADKYIITVEIPPEQSYPVDPVNGTYILYRTGDNVWEGYGNNGLAATLSKVSSHWEIDIPNSTPFNASSPDATCPPAGNVYVPNSVTYTVTVDAIFEDDEGAYPIVMPILNKGLCDVINHKIVPQFNMSFMVYETTKENGQNQLNIYLNNYGDTATVTSTPYDVGVFHHFCFTSAAASFKLYIDGLEDDGATIDGTIPSGLYANSDPLYINDVAPGFEEQVAYNNGILDDLIIFEDELNEFDIRRIANLGAIYVADSTYNNLEEISQTILTDDPSTTQITSVHTSRGNLFVGKTNGQLLRGVRSLWESRREFADDRELGYITTINKDSESSATVLDGKLTLSNQTIRI